MFIPKSSMLSLRTSGICFWARIQRWFHICHWFLLLLIVYSFNDIREPYFTCFRAPLNYGKFLGLILLSAASWVRNKIQIWNLRAILSRIGVVKICCRQNWPMWFLTLLSRLTCGLLSKIKFPLDFPAISFAKGSILSTMTLLVAAHSRSLEGLVVCSGDVLDKASYCLGR